jgi:hypothetical protein
MGDTKLPSKRAKLESEFAGVSVAHIGGDKTLVLCQEAYRTFSVRCSCYPKLEACITMINGRRRKGADNHRQLGRSL